MQKSLVSVIMPVYNAEKFLAEAIESILNQTYQNFEFIILNDGSEDASIDIINSYSTEDARIKVISRKNKGLVETLNEGLTLSEGKYICRMDADDISKPTRIEKQVRFLEESPNVVLVGCYFDLLVENGTEQQLLKSIYNIQNMANQFTNQSRQDIFSGYVLLHPTWMIRCDLINEIGVYGTFAHCEDGEFLFRVLSTGHKIGVVEERLFQYRIYNTSKSGNDRLKNLGIKKDTIRYHIEYLQNCFKKGFQRKYMIWGTDITGKIANDMISTKFPNAIFLGFLDSFAKEQQENNGIYRPEVLKNHSEVNEKSDNFFDCDYVFIATNSGMRYAIDF